jgi:hypothetical protein
LLLEEARDTVRPGAEAGVKKVSVPVEAVPPGTDEGLKVRVQLGTVMVSVATADWPFAEAVIELDVTLATETVRMVNVPVVEPAATTIVAGTEASDALPEVRVTDRPPDGAGPVRVTCPVELDPPGTEVGFNVSPETAGG